MKLATHAPYHMKMCMTLFCEVQSRGSRVMALFRILIHVYPYLLWQCKDRGYTHHNQGYQFVQYHNLIVSTCTVPADFSFFICRFPRIFPPLKEEYVAEQVVKAIQLNRKQLIIPWLFNPILFFKRYVISQALWSTLLFCWL